MLSTSLLAGGSWLVESNIFSLLEPAPTYGRNAEQDPFAGGKQLGVVDFVGEGAEALDTPSGAELDGRLFTDLSRLTPNNFVTPTEKFYIRTRASRLLDTKNPWSIQVGGPAHAVTIPVRDLIRDSEPQGIRLMECSGNPRSGHFGLISVADWDGVPLSRLSDRVHPPPRHDILISGFDTYSAQSMSSIPGASWIFSWEDLLVTGAFLATKMNGLPLTLDHGAPIRLVVPNWYGCTCIKWVNEISVVDADAEATSQMQEYASRTHQHGVPRFVKEYESATIDPAAMPVRVEKWRIKDRILYRVVGIQWGGTQPVKAMQIRFNPTEEYVPVDTILPGKTDSWTFWMQAWTPPKPGRYAIQLRVTNPQVRTRRLDMGFYVRFVDITEV